MFDWDFLTWLIMGTVLILLFAAMIGSVVYIWMAVAPLLFKIIWTLVISVLALVIMAMSILVVDC